jgi:hypothetical protein
MKYRFQKDLNCEYFPLCNNHGEECKPKDCYRYNFFEGNLTECLKKNLKKNLVDLVTFK